MTGQSEETPHLSGSELDLTMVVPYYNPGNRLRPHVEALIAVLKESGLKTEIIAVSDGSTDASDKSLDGLAPWALRSIKLPSNQGKGEALRVGLAMGRGRYVGFIDGDGDLPASLVGSFIEVALADHPDIVLGSKRHPCSQVIYPPIRRLYSWGYQQLVRVLFGLPVRDTQTGIKVVRRAVLADVLPLMVEKRYAFDLELLVAARQRGHQKISELPVRIEQRFTSTVSLPAAWSMLVDTFGIFYRLKVRRAYGEPSKATADSDPPNALRPAGEAGPARSPGAGLARPPSYFTVKAQAISDGSSSSTNPTANLSLRWAEKRTWL